MKHIPWLLGSLINRLPLLVTGWVMLMGISLNALASPELALEQTVSQTTVLSGEKFTLSLRYRCASTTEHCFNVKVTNELPDGVADGFSDVAPTSSPHVESMHYDDTARIVTWDFFPQLDAGSTGEIALTLFFPNGTTPDGTSLTNRAQIEADNANTVISNEVTVTAQAISEVILDKVQGSGNRINQDVNYRIKLCNEDGMGRLNLHDYVIVDTLLPNTQFVSAQGGGVYDSATNTITWPARDLLLGECVDYRVRVLYPIEHFTENDTFINQVTVTGTPVGLPKDSYVDTDEVQHTLLGVQQEGSVTLWKQANKQRLIGETLDYGFYVKNIGLITIDKVTITDPVPPQIAVTSIRAGDNNLAADSVPVSVFYQTNSNATWMALPGSPLSTPPTQVVSVDTLELAEGDYITNIRWEFPAPVGYVAQGGRDKTNGFSGTVLSVDRDGNPVEIGDIITNLASYSLEYEGGFAAERSTRSRTTVITESAGPELLKEIVGPSTITPGDTFTYQLTLRNSENEPVINPVITDLLDAQLEYVDWTVVSKYDPAFPDPLFEKVENYADGKTLLRWSFADAQLPRNASGVTLGLTVRIKKGTLPGNIDNQAYVTADNPSNAIQLDTCQDRVADSYDLDGDGDSIELVCASENVEVTASSVAAMDAVKWVQGQLDTYRHRYPQAGKTALSGTLRYDLIVKNTGNVPMTNLVVVDILPYINDTGVIDPSLRESEWQPYLIGAVQAGSGITVYYSTEENPCRTEVLPTNPSGCQSPEWTTVLPTDIPSVRSLRFDFGDKVIEPGDELTLSWPMYAPIDALVGGIAWNSFGYVVSREDTGEALLPSEPIKVGIEVGNFEPAIYGDRVWLDTDGNGIQDEGEMGKNGVRVELYQPGEDTLPGTEDDKFIGFTLTANGPDDEPGFYLFSFLPPGSYFTKFIPPVGYGVSPQNRGGNDTRDSDVHVTTHMTKIVTLGREDDDRTWDMGLIEKASAALGDYVWMDINEDGIQNESSDNGRNGVTVTLYRDNGDGLADPSTDTEVTTTVTASNVHGHPGYYLFEELDPGAYFVTVALPSDGQGFTSAQAGPTEVDSDVGTDGISEVVVLSAKEVNTTVDAGIIKMQGNLSLGNLVWRDENADGLYDAADELGINDVTVNLYRDTDGNGHYTADQDELVTSTITYTKGGKAGSYLFEELIPGDYIVQIDPDNFKTDRALDDLFSSVGAPNPNNGVDNDDNGLDGSDLDTTGVVTAAITLSETNLTIDFGFDSMGGIDPWDDCSTNVIYAVQDHNLSDSQFFVINPVSKAVTTMGGVYDGYDIEGLDVCGDKLYAISGDDTLHGNPRGQLYEVEPGTAALTPIGAPNGYEISAISCRLTDNSLWGWRDGHPGPLKIDTSTGAVTSAPTTSPSPCNGLGIEGLTWDSTGTRLYASEGQNLWLVWDGSLPTCQLVCNDLLGETEALDVMDIEKGGSLLETLLFAIHTSTDLNLYGVDTSLFKGGLPVSCQFTEFVEKIDTTFYDVEGATWPVSCPDEN